VDLLSREDRLLFARCIGKDMPIMCPLDTIAEFLDPNQRTESMHDVTPGIRHIASAYDFGGSNFRRSRASFGELLLEP
jgi:hypothetical protein